MEKNGIPEQNSLDSMEGIAMDSHIGKAGVKARSFKEVLPKLKKIPIREMPNDFLEQDLEFKERNREVLEKAMYTSFILGELSESSCLPNIVSRLGNNLELLAAAYELRSTNDPERTLAFSDLPEAYKNFVFNEKINSFPESPNTDVLAKLKAKLFDGIQIPGSANTEIDTHMQKQFNAGRVRVQHSLHFSVNVASQNFEKLDEGIKRLRNDEAQTISIRDLYRIKFPCELYAGEAEYATTGVGLLEYEDLNMRLPSIAWLDEELATTGVGKEWIDRVGKLISLPLAQILLYMNEKSYRGNNFALHSQGFLSAESLGVKDNPFVSKVASFLIVSCIKDAIFSAAKKDTNDVRVSIEFNQESEIEGPAIIICSSGNEVRQLSSESLTLLSLIPQWKVFDSENGESFVRQIKIAKHL